MARLAARHGHHRRPAGRLAHPDGNRANRARRGPARRPGLSST
jgi:hypothetical protein